MVKKQFIISAALVSAYMFARVEDGPQMDPTKGGELIRQNVEVGWRYRWGGPVGIRLWHHARHSFSEGESVAG